MDRISNLPESLISNILSLLPTKDVFRTSILSTQWKSHWKCIFRLDFDEYDFPVPSIRTSITHTRFANFINQILPFLQVTSLESFRLRCYNGDLHVNEWVSSALSRNVQQLDISIPSPGQHFPPCSLFTSTTLVVLKLGRNFVLQVPTTFSLASLKILHLESIEFLDDDSLSRFISSCPILEDLKMEGPVGENIKVISISSLGLEKLALIDICYASTSDVCNYEIVLNTPNLNFFLYLNAVLPKRFSIAKLHNLVRACIYLEDPTQTVDEHETLNEYENKKIDLFVGISNVQFLSLVVGFVGWDEIPAVICRRLPKFPHLKHLRIDGGASIGVFLENSPHLQTLVIEGKSRDDHDYYLEGWHPPTSVPSCMLFHLKVIEVYTFRGQEEDMRAVRYFLDNSQVLEKLRIQYSSSDEYERLEMRKKLLDLPRASRSCNIVMISGPEL